MIYGITYADERMTISAGRCERSMYYNGIDSVRVSGPSKLSDDFQIDNHDALNSERGAGFWIWKAWIINKMMSYLCDDGDIIIYADAGIEFVAPVKHIIERMDEDIFFFTNGHKQIEWCKMDVLDTMIKDHDKYDWNVRKQVQASVIFFKVNQTTRDFVKEWLLWCQMPGFIDDSPSKLPNYPTFQEHRHDQAILTCLQIKYGYKLHFWPTQYSGHLYRPDGDNYPVMFDHHRKRNNEYKTVPA